MSSDGESLHSYDGVGHIYISATEFVIVGRSYVPILAINTDVEYGVVST